MRTLLRLMIAVTALLLSPSAWATNYYISPTGSNSNNGTATSTPWLTFTYAFANMAGSPTSCGHTLNLLDGVYGDGTSTGKIALTKACTQGAPLTIRALNSRQARMNDSGNGWAVELLAGTNWVTLDGLVFNSTNNSAFLNGGAGGPFRATTNDHITVRQSLCRNPNKYTTRACMLFTNNNHGLIEDTEFYDFHRHAITWSGSQNMVARRVYANPRTGRISGGLGSAPVGAADALIAFYPCFTCIMENSIAENRMYLAEMNASFAQNTLLKDSKILGSILLDSNYGVGIYPNGRAGSPVLNYSPQSLTVEHTALVNFTSASECIRNVDGVNFTVNRFTCIGDGTGSGHGLHTDDGTNGVAAAQMSFTYTSNIIYDRGGTGYLNSDTPGSFTGTNNYSFSNGTAFNPSAATFGSGNVTTDPGFGDCKLWLPDGAAGAGKGAEILSRYLDGTLTATPLWDPTTGEFPHGVTDLDGTNDDVGDSLFDVHTRLNVPYSGDTHMCDFPASYTGGTPPSNPAGLVDSQGTTSPSHARTVTASKEALVAGIALYDSAANVGTVTGVVSSCGSEALTSLGTTVTSPAYRRVYLYGRLNPTAGSCTISVTTTGNVTASVLISNEYDDVAAFGTIATATGLSGTPSVTVAVAQAAGNTILDMLASKCGLSGGACTTSLSAGADQTLLDDQGHLTLGDIRGAMSEQASTDSLVMDYSTGNNYWAMVAVPLCAVSCDALTHVLTQVAGQVDSAFYVNGAVSHLGAVDAANVNVPVGTSFRVCLQTDSTVAAVPLAGRKLYFSRNSGAYVPMLDTATTGISFHGATADPNVVSGAVSANLEGVLTNVPGESIHSVNTVPFATMTQDDSLVNCWTVKTEPTATATDTYEFREYTDAGVALDAYNADADAKVTVTGTTPDIAAPTGLQLSGVTATDVTLTWAASTYATFAGYKIFQSTESGVYSTTPTVILTPAIATATNTPTTRWIAKTLVGDTYYWVVKAFDQDGNDSAASSEVSSVQAGFDPTAIGTRTASGARTTFEGRGLRCPC